MTAQLSARAIFAEECTCGGEDWACCADDSAYLVRIKAPDGVSYLAPYPAVTMMLRLDVLDLGDDFDQWAFVVGTETRQMDWFGLRPAARPSSAIFHRAVVDVLVGQGLMILPLERDLHLTHQPPGAIVHALMWGEDHVGWIAPANADRIRELGKLDEYVQAVPL